MDIDSLVVNCVIAEIHKTCSKQLAYKNKIHV